MRRSDAVAGVGQHHVDRAVRAAAHGHAGVGGRVAVHLARFGGSRPDAAGLDAGRRLAGWRRTGRGQGNRQQRDQGNPKMGSCSVVLRHRFALFLWRGMAIVAAIEPDFTFYTIARRRCQLLPSAEKRNPPGGFAKLPGGCWLGQETGQSGGNRRLSVSGCRASSATAALAPAATGESSLPCRMSLRLTSSCKAWRRVSVMRWSSST